MIFAPKPPVEKEPVLEQTPAEPAAPVVPQAAETAPAQAAPVQPDIPATPVEQAVPAETAPVQSTPEPAPVAAGPAETRPSDVVSGPAETRHIVTGPAETSHSDNSILSDSNDAQEIKQSSYTKSSDLKRIDEVWFSDLYFTPEKIAYVRDPHTQFALMPFEAEDLMDFHKALEEGFQGASSYSIHFGKSLFRIERIKTVTGPHYTARRMPLDIPSIYDLSIPDALVKQLISLNTATGLILICGPTGMGKTTTCSALLKTFLETEGGFAYTIEDPPEMPLDGLYRCKKGGFGVCKQCEVTNNNWDLGLRSALRSKPRYILVGEIRTAETASELLRAATSGHLVISTVHANNLEDGLNAITKYAMAGGMNQELASDLLARGILAIVHQKLVGTVRLAPSFLYCFANPNPLEADQMRMIIREGKVNLSTLMEAQMAKMIQGRPLFKNT